MREKQVNNEQVSKKCQTNKRETNKQTIKWISDQQTSYQQVSE